MYLIVLISERILTYTCLMINHAHELGAWHLFLFSEHVLSDLKGKDSPKPWRRKGHPDNNAANALSASIFVSVTCGFLSMHGIPRVVLRSSNRYTQIRSFSFLPFELCFMCRSTILKLPYFLV